MLFGLIVTVVSDDAKEEIRLMIGMMINNNSNKAEPKNEASNVLKNDFIYVKLNCTILLQRYNFFYYHQLKIYYQHVGFCYIKKRLLTDVGNLLVSFDISLSELVNSSYIKRFVFYRVKANYAVVDKYHDFCHRL